MVGDERFVRDGPIVSFERWVESPTGPQQDHREKSFSDDVVFLRDGEPIAGLRKMPSEELRRTRPRDSGSSPLRKFRDWFADENLFYLDDQSGRLAARITRSGGYVIELQAGTSEPLASIAVAACIANYGFVKESGGGGGGAA